MIRKAVQRMTQLIDDLLSLARMGRRELIRVPFDFGGGSSYRGAAAIRSPPQP